MKEIEKLMGVREGIKVVESKYQISINYYGKKIMVLRISSNVVVAGLPLMDNTVKSQLAISNTKLKETFTVIRVNNKDLYNTTMKIFDVKYDLVVSSSRNRKDENDLNSDDKKLNSTKNIETRKGVK